MSFAVKKNNPSPPTLNYHLVRIIYKIILLLFGFHALITDVSFAQIPKNVLSPAEREKLETLLRSMTLSEKIGQLSLYTAGYEMTGPGGQVNLKQLIREGKAGSVFNVVSADSAVALQKLAAGSRLGIPLLFGYDVIHGYRTIFPIPLAQACMWDPEAIRRIERTTATEASAAGINWTFAPMVDLARDPRWGRVAEGSGEDTWLGCRIAAARVRGFQGDDLKAGNSVLACPKHFAAYGAAQAGRDYHTADLSTVSLLEWYLPPYKAAIDAGAGSVMTSFNEIAGVPSTCNPWLLKDILRKSWGFDGFVVTDWTSITETVAHGVAADLSDAARLALNAGVDMDMMGGSYTEALEALVKQGLVSQARIDSAVRSVLEAKFKLGLFDDPYRRCSREREKNEILTKENRAQARRAAAECCVLLKNERNTLPIPTTIRHIAVIGPLGNAKADMIGCWGAQGRAEECVTLLEGIRNRLGTTATVTFTRGCSISGTERTGLDSALAESKKADFIVLALGESEEMSGEASSRAHLELPGFQQELAEKIAALGKPCAAVLFNGRPLVLTRLAGTVPAILEAWQGGTEAGNGVADVLFGAVNPAGKLTMSFPRSEGQIPVFYNAKPTGRPQDPANKSEKYVSRYIDEVNEPLWPFGFGLSYTTFACSGLKAAWDGEKIDVSVTVANTGNTAGAEVVQLYLRDNVATLTRPVKELRGFEKVFLEKGESKQLSFTLSKDDLAFVHSDLRRYYEAGVFTVFAGGSSDASLSATVAVP